MNRHFIEEPLMRLGEKKTPAQPASPLWQGFRGVPHLEINRETGKMRYNPPEPAPVAKRVTRPSRPSNTWEFPQGGFGEFYIAAESLPVRLLVIADYLTDWKRSGHDPLRPKERYVQLPSQAAERIIALCLYHRLGFAITANPNNPFDITIKE